MRRSRHVCDPRARESAANNVARMWEADEVNVPLVKNWMSMLTTTINMQLEVVAKGHPAPTLGQAGVPTAEVIVPQLLQPLGPPIQ